MKARISVFVICVKAIIYMLLYDLHDCTFNFEKLAKLWGKRAFLEYWTSITRVQKIIFRSLQVAYNTYDSIYKELLSMNSDVLIHQSHLRFLLTEVFKSVNNLDQHFVYDYF